MEKQTRERALMEELFADHFKLADRFNESACKIDRVYQMLRGSEGSKGVISILQEACDALGPIADGELDMKVAALIWQAQTLPDRLMKIPEEETFRLSVHNAFTELFEEVVEARRNTGIEFTSHELELLLKRAAKDAGDTVFGDAALNSAKLSQAQKEIENLKSQNLVMMNTLATAEAMSKQAMEKMGDDLKGISEKLASANLRRFGLSSLAVAFALGIFMHGPATSLVDSGLELLHETARASVAAEKQSPW